MKSSVSTLGVHDTLRDFTADRRLLALSAMAVVTGTCGAGAAWVLLKLIALVTNYCYFHTFSTATSYLSHARLGPSSILIPIIGGIIVGLMARYGSDKIRGHGIPEALEAILIGQSRIQPKVAVLKPLSSAIAIGTGGPFGAEGPIIMTGGALGSLFAQFFHLSSAERKTLLVAGAAAGMTGIFGTPVAAVLLAIEVMLFEWKPRSFVPVVVSAIVAMAWRPWLVGPWPLFPHSGIPAMPWWGLAACAGVGIIAGLQSVITTGGLYWFEDLFEKLPVHWMWWPAIAGVVVGIGGLIDPAALGVGYDNIGALINGTVLMHAAIALLVVKAVIWVVALASGTSGGTLAPLLMMGGAVGVLEAHVLPFGDAGFWALLAMSAVLGGTLRCPMTATIFAIELTGDLHVMPAVLVACVASFAVTVLLMKRSILTERLARRGRHLSYEYTVDPFEVMPVGEIMTHPVHTLPASMTTEDVLAFYDNENGVKRHKSYPVVDDAGLVIGMVSRSDVLRWSREGWPEGQTLEDRRDVGEAFVGYTDEMIGHLADRMAAADVGRVPIVDRATGKLAGLLARRDLLRVRANAAKLERERSSPLTLQG
ncbi:MAG TPA: chloride channel protein [Steroidobacteraceae bacterium]|nr:chloride channel protein [Steroidobacteraceae bacterium]